MNICKNIPIDLICRDILVFMQIVSHAPSVSSANDVFLREKRAIRESPLRRKGEKNEE